jgi:amino acid adenylation domain-containing protein
VIGSPIANRNVLETERLIGFFANTLALRLDLEGDPAFAQLADRARSVCLDAYAHQDLPFEKLVEELAPARQAGTTPLFNVMLVLQNVPLRLAVPGLAVELLDAGSGTAKFDLAVFLMESGGELLASIEFRRDLFDEATIERLTGHLRTLLTGAIAAPAARLSELPLLSPAERSHLALQAAAPPSAIAASLAAGRRLAHLRVADQAARTPDAVAAVFEDSHLSYDELAARSRRLAGHLQRLGVGPDVVVGLYLERSLEAMTALLGIMAAGGAFLALDPDSPVERLRLMLDDARAPVIVTQALLADQLPAGGAGAARLVVVDRPAHDPLDAADRDAATATPLPPPPHGDRLLADHLIYVCYTSGSTGRPKGVAMPHGALAAMLDWQLRTSHAADRTLNFTSLSFDVSFQELFATWSAGGTLVLIGEEVRRDPAALANLLARQQVTRLFLPFVALQQLAVAALAAPPQGFPGALREVLSAGEQLYVTPQVAAFAARLPGAALYNHYGPTEAHAVTWLPLTGDPAAWPERPSIGGPLDHARILLLDRNLRRVPQGVPGEVWAAGPGLARGYLGRRRLTAERFLPDPFADVPGWRPGARMYRVGDVARQLADGTLEFLGRTDFQVKVRGHRIEVAEIETALARHPAVSQAAVVAHGEDAASRRLVACVVCAPQVTAPTAADLRAWLGRTLPAAMVPSGWLRAARLPLTATGKLDRRALERWAGGAFAAPDPAAAAAGYDVAPLDATAVGAAADAAGAADQGQAASLRHPAEELMAGIWREVLGAAEVAAADDFFALGGHSLLATQVVSRIREVFGVELPLRRLFEEPTVAAMTAAVLALRALGANGANGADGDGGDDPAVAAPPIVRVARDRPLPLSFAQERLWFLDRLQPGGSAYNLPLLLRASGPLAPARLAAALSRVVQRHEVLRTRYAEQDGRPVQIVDDAAPVAVPVADLAALPADRRQEEARRLVAAAAGQPFDLARGPVLRVLMVALGQDGPLLLATLHHIAADGWSMGVLVREMQAAWAARPAALPPPLSVQYADFAVWQRQWLAGAPLARQLGWWREQLRGARAVLEVPADRPRPPVATQRGAEHVFALDAGLTARLAAAATRHGATLFMALAGGLHALLARLSGERDLILGTPIANRNRIQIEPLIGCFVNMLALRVQVDGQAAWGDLLAAVRETSLGAYAHQDLPFEMLVDQVAPQRDLSRPPLVQVAMALQNAPLPVADLDGVRLTSHEPGSGTAKLDLTWSFAAGADGRLDATLQYAADLFDAATAARLARRFGVLLEELLSQPLARVAAAALLAPAERHQLLHEWNDTVAPPLPTWDDRAVAPAVHHQVERHAALSPQALAVCRGAQRLTYGELDAQADHLAWQLRRAGAGQDAPVALWLERSPELVVATLAALKAGAAYLPLDPAWPAARVEAILDQARVRVLVAGAEQSALAGAAADDAAGDDAAGDDGSRRGVRRLDVLQALTLPAAGAPAERVAGPPPAVVLPGTLAYVIYTSGSTGEPKGVEVSHGALAGMVRWNATAYGWGAGERGTMLATPSFDASVFEIWPVLASGASLHIPEAEVRLVPDRLLAWLASEGITVSFLPTALAGQVVEAAERALPAGDMRLRTVLSGGDRMRRPPARPLPFAVVNLYGPAESTVVSTVGTCSIVPSGGGEPSIGRPVDDTRIYLVDAAGELVVPGVPGEMYLAGRGLARGYLGRPDLTAERFLPDPWSGQAGSRLYRTGDVARHAPIGDLHFLGRVDAQVKVRGCRIEPAEIEAALRRHPGVRQAAVVPRRQPSGEMQLVGYVVFAPPAADPAAAEPAAATAPAQLRALLAAELPEYMVPAVLVELPELPITPNGKLDRAALPAPPDRLAAAATFTAPRNDRERIVADAWREVLGRERIGVDESFFAVGGSSLAMVQLQSRLRSALGREVPLLELFRHPTIEGLAASLGQDAAATADAAAGAAEQARARVATRRESLRRQQVRRRAPGAAAAPGDRAKAGDNHD